MTYRSGHRTVYTTVYNEDYHAPCEECESKRWVYMWHSGDGHGGLNGGARDWFPCHICNSDKRYYDRMQAGHYKRESERLFPKEEDMEASVAEATTTDTKSGTRGRYIVLKELSEDSLLILDEVDAANAKTAVRKVAFTPGGDLIDGTYIAVPITSFKRYTPKIKTTVSW